MKSTIDMSTNKAQIENNSGNFVSVKNGTSLGSLTLEKQYSTCAEKGLSK